MILCELIERSNTYTYYTRMKQTFSKRCLERFDQKLLNLSSSHTSSQVMKCGFTLWKISNDGEQILDTTSRERVVKMKTQTLCP